MILLTALTEKDCLLAAVSLYRDWYRAACWDTGLSLVVSGWQNAGVNQSVKSSKKRLYSVTAEP